jgi:glycosyltransferase involved in cell wall biosynthesis
MRILHIISQRPDSTGSGIYIQEMIDASRRNNHSNALVAGIQLGEHPSLSLTEDHHCNFVEFGNDTLAMQIVGMSDVMPYASTRFRDLSENDIACYENSFADKISQAISIFQPEIIHSHHLWIMSSLTARLFPHIPIVTTCHGSDIRQFQNCPHLQKRVLSGCKQLTAVLALSEAQKEEIAQLYTYPSEKITVVGGGYNNRLFYQEEKPSPVPVRLLYAGKLSRAKGVPWLLKAIATLDSGSYHLDLVGGGHGEEYDHCLKLAEEQRESVTVHGAVPQAELAELMRKAHVMVLPSLYEGLPLIMLEALASGCRVIASKIPGTRKIASVINTPYIELVQLPERNNVDEIQTEDEVHFTRNLSEALRSSIDAARFKSDLDIIPLRHKLDHFSWDQVFTRTEATYYKALQISI